MKSIIIKSLTLVAVAATILSFTNSGGEGFEIFLNDKVVIQQFGNSMNTVKDLRLNQRASTGQLTVKYHHCNQVGRNRILTVKDAQNKVLKEWRFADAASSIASPLAMICNVKDILRLNNNNESTLKLYYASSELPKGRLLANIIVESSSVANNK